MIIRVLSGENEKGEKGQGGRQRWTETEMDVDRDGRQRKDIRWRNKLQ